MEKELNIIKNWGILYIVLMVIGEIVILNEFGNTMLFVTSFVVDSIYAYILYIVLAKIKSQNIIIEQNKEIIKLLSK